MYIKMLPDKLLVNLKVLGKIEKNGKVSKSYDGLVAVSKSGYLQGLYRIFNHDSRRQTIYEISNIIHELGVVLNSIYNSKENSTSPNYDTIILKDLSILLEESNSVYAGLCNLRFTYISDINTTAHLDVLLIKIESLIEEANVKYKSYIGKSYARIQSH
jgi:hypothetical protein